MKILPPHADFFHVMHELPILQIPLVFRDTQAAKDELEKGREELQDMMERLRESKDMEAEERQRLEDEIRSKHEEVTVIQNQVPSNSRKTQFSLLKYFTAQKDVIL